jgi:hypothetical protein
MERIAILTQIPGWRTKLSRIINALRAGKITALTLYVDDWHMQRLVEESCTDLPPEIRPFVKLLAEIAEGQKIVDTWQIGVK